MNAQTFFVDQCKVNKFKETIKTIKECQLNCFTEFNQDIRLKFDDIRTPKELDSFLEKTFPSISNKENNLQKCWIFFLLILVFKFFFKK